MYKHFVSICFLLVFGTVYSQVEQGRKTVETLCSPAFHGRGYVDGGDSIAAEFIAAEFKAMGCKFFDSNPFQSFGFKVNTFPDQVQLNIDGKELVAGVDFVVSYDSPTFHEKNIMLLPVETADLFDGKALKNKISRVAMAGRKQALALLFNFDQWKADTLKMAKELLKTMNSAMPVVELVNSKFTWSVVQTQTAFPRFQVQQAAIDLQKGQWQMTTAIHAVLKNHIARNVIAYVPAKKKSKKYFVFSAHYDHLGQMGEAAYFPGANDNASGTAMLLEMARHYALNPADVNIVFMAFAGEEVGLLGSLYYTENPIFALKNIQFLVNLDIMGSGEDGATVVNATVFPNYFEWLTQINDEKKYLPIIKSRGKAANSDHYFFSEKGVPAFFMYTMGPNKHYHDTGDTYEALSFDKFNAIVNLLIDFQQRLSCASPKK
jgi:hypothetical protein